MNKQYSTGYDSVNKIEGTYGLQRQSTNTYVDQAALGPFATIGYYLLAVIA